MQTLVDRPQFSTTNVRLPFVFTTIKVCFTIINVCFMIFQCFLIGPSKARFQAYPAFCINLHLPFRRRSAKTLTRSPSTRTRAQAEGWITHSVGWLWLGLGYKIIWMMEGNQETCVIILHLVYNFRGSGHRQRSISLNSPKTLKTQIFRSGIEFPKKCCFWEGGRL